MLSIRDRIGTGGLRYAAAVLGALVIVGSAGAVVIDNDIPQPTLGHWSVDITTGGGSVAAILTANRLASGDVVTDEILFEYVSFVDPGNDGGGFTLFGSAPVIDPGDPDSVSSSGSFLGASGNTINWSVKSSIPDGRSLMTSVFTFSAATGTLGTLRFLQYMDEDIQFATDDVFFTRGSVAANDLELFTVDNTEVYGVSHSGVLSRAAGLRNASFAGWAADQFDGIRPRIVGSGQGVEPGGVILNLSPIDHPQVGPAHGPGDIVSVLAWDLDTAATQATVVTTLGGVPDVTVVQCGNGTVEGSEECDDANAVPSDGCTNDCTICGNGNVTPPEECDDGNIVSGDDCSAACRSELIQLRGNVFANPRGADGAGDRFGAAIAVLGDWVFPFVTGTPFADGSGGRTDSGAVYRFSSHTSFLQTFGASAGDRFGAAVAALGQNHVVGAPLHDGGAGAAYVFSGNPGPPLHTLPLPGDVSLAGGDQFGFTVAALGSDVLVGAPGTAVGGQPDAGIVYLFSGATGRLVRTFGNPSPVAGEQFGAALAAAGGVVLVGAPSHGDSTVENAGAAYLFDANGNFLRRFRKRQPAAGDLLGAAVACTDVTFFVGAPFDDGEAEDAGAVYVFAATGDEPVRALRKDAPAAGDRLGVSLAVLGSNVLVGAPGDGTVAPSAGAAYLFDPAGPVLEPFFNPSPERNDRFGAAVAAAGEYVFVGAPGDDASAEDAGVAYGFTVCSAPPCPSVCANLVVELPEECDDGNLIDGDGCDANCTVTRCGNDRAAGSEECDGADDAACGGSGCRPDCTCVPGCGGGEALARAGDQPLITTSGAVTSCCGAPAGSSCNDGNKCTGPDQCDESSVCVGTPVDCGDSFDCTDDSCDPALGCIRTPIDTQCDDATCTRDSCNPQDAAADARGCVHTPIANCCRVNTDCGRGNACVQQPRCQACPACDEYRLPCCERGSVCQPGVAYPDFTPCEDGNICTAQDSCRDGICVGSGTCMPQQPPPCDDANLCTDDMSNPEGVCTHVDNTAACDDGNSCTVGDTCAAAVCGGSPTTFDGLADRIGVAVASSCGDERVSKGIRKALKRASSLVRRAGLNAKKVRKLLGKASKKLDATTGKVNAAGGLSNQCRAGLEESIRQASSQVTCLMSPG